jgi:hypothetical protein
MSLVVALDVNTVGTGAGIIIIQRLTGTDDPDSLNRYRYEMYSGAHPQHDVIYSGAVVHRYGDGAFALLKHVLAHWEATAPPRLA